jgi:hypothetical protein
MALLTRLTELAVATESVKGTAETLEAADVVILAEDVTFAYAPQELARNPYRNHISPMASVPGARIGTMTARVEFKGSGTATTPPSIGLLLKGCGFAEDVQTASVVYTPVSTDALSSTLTMAAYMDGTCFKMYGARGNLSLAFNANQLVYGDFTFTGIFDGLTDTAMLGGTFESTIPVPWYNASLSWNFGASYVPSCISALSLDLNNTVTIRQCANATYGLTYALITARDYGGTVDPDAVLVTTQDWMGHLGTPTTGSLAFSVGTEAGNTIAFAAPAFQVTSLTPGDRDGIRTWMLPYKLRGSSGNDELTITFS